MENNHKKISFTIDGKEVHGHDGETILEVARKNDISIPALCTHPDVKTKSGCRMCLVQIDDKKDLVTSCSTKIQEDMRVITTSDDIEKARKINLELIFAQHTEECKDCVLSFNCQLLDLAKAHKIPIARFKDRKTKYDTYQFGPAIQFDSKKCIDCGICIEICHQQGVDYLESKKNGDWHEVGPTDDPNKSCVYCGQCIVHCPVGAFEAVGEFEDVEKFLLDKSKTVVVQFAPSIRSSIGEEFGMPHGSIVTEQLAGAIKALGVDAVFDTSVGADITTIEEANELIERIEENKGLPMFTSCCPAWVRFVELNYQEFIPNLTTVRSPQIILGGVIKTYWAKQKGIDPKNIISVSVMPCTSKKYEITRNELQIDGMNPVDQVLTTRELAFLLHKRKIDISKVKKIKPDSPFGIPSGAGVIYGASGGVMESALRTAYFKLLGKNLKNIDLQVVRGLRGHKRAIIPVGDKKLRVGVVNGLGNARRMMEDMRAGKIEYDYVEVMSCSGGCIGGGGQPVPTSSEIRRKRAQSLYDIDKSKVNRLAHENPYVDKIYKEHLDDPEINEAVCYTSFSPKKFEKYKKI